MKNLIFLIIFIIKLDLMVMKPRESILLTKFLHFYENEQTEGKKR